MKKRAGMKRFNNGSMQLGKPWGVPIRVHWTAPVVPFVFSGFSFQPVFLLAYMGLILVHELGHVFMVRRARKQVTLVVVDGTGGACHWRGETTNAQQIAIAWGGVLAQLAVLLIALVVLAVFGRATTSVGAQLERVAIGVNICIIALNLLPVGHLDGVVAWRIIPAARAAWARRRRDARARRERTTAAKGTLRALERLDNVDDDVAGNDPLALIVADVNQQRPRR